MNIIETGFKGLYLSEPRVFSDERGYFFESFNRQVWANVGIELDFVQDNESKSVRGTLRGLHYQVHPWGQTKLVRVTKGKILDVVLDLRENEATYGQTFSAELSDENKMQLLIPKGFAHAFICLTDEVVFDYKCDNYYKKESEAGIYPLDPKLNIDWKLEKDEIILSEKDRNAPVWGEHQKYRS